MEQNTMILARGKGLRVNRKVQYLHNISIIVIHLVQKNHVALTAFTGISKRLPYHTVHHCQFYATMNRVIIGLGNGLSPVWC